MFKSIQKWLHNSFIFVLSFYTVYIICKYKFQNIKWVIRSRKSKDRQYSMWPKEKITNNDLQNMTQITKGRTTWTPLKPEVFKFKWLLFFVFWFCFCFFAFVVCLFCFFSFFLWWYLTHWSTSINIILVLMKTCASVLNVV